MFAYCANSPVNMVDPSGKLPMGVKPMEVAINDGMPSSNGPSAWKDPPHIPEEYDISLSRDIRNAHDAITTWVDEYGELSVDGFGLIHSTVSIAITVLAYVYPGLAIPKAVIVAMDIVAGVFWVREIVDFSDSVAEKVGSK